MLKSINMWSLPAAWGQVTQLPETFRQVKALGFDGIELSFDPNGPIGFASTTAEMTALRRAAEAAGITITSMATGAFWETNFAQDDPEKRATAHRVTEKMLELGQALGVRSILVIPGAVDVCFIPSEPVVSYDAVMTRATEALRALAPACERTGVRIGVETVWNRCLQSPLEMCRMLDDVGSPFIGAYLDVGNVILTGYPEQWIRILGSRLVAVHFKDFRRNVGTLDGFVDLLEGDVNWPAVMAALHEIGYDGAVTAEMIPHYGHYPLARVENASNAMDWILGRKR